MAFKILQADITTLRVDAIVNAANTQLLAGGGVCGAIFRAAGYQKLQAACDKLSPIQTGEAVMTPGFNLPAKFIIHTAGPIYNDGNHGEAKLLAACYINSLKLAAENNLRSIAFPLISSGIYGYPAQEALAVAVTSIKNFLQTHDMEIFLAVINPNLIALFNRLENFN
ncbi:MAG: macro domain-containing protein [Selenomonadaceae bacterium]|nr:macro domain-containing protein [Selenomonadaceae bacterium]